VKVSNKNMIDPLHPLPVSFVSSKLFQSLTTPKANDAIGNVAYVPIANKEFAFTRFFLFTISGTTASLEGCLISENISDKKFIKNIEYKLSAKNKNITNIILVTSQNIIIIFLSYLSAINPANEDKRAGTILAINGTIAVSSEFPASVPR
jgi:hypothetical protein